MTVWEIGLLLSWALLVVLAFGMSGLMRQIAEVREQVQGAPGAGMSEAPSTLSARSLRVLSDRGAPPYVVLLSDAHCFSCQQLKAWLSDLPEHRRRRILVAEREAGPMPAQPPAYRFVRDDALFSELDRGITPFVVLADEDGRIVSARPVGGVEEFEQVERALPEFAVQHQASRS